MGAAPSVAAPGRIDERRTARVASKGVKTRLSPGWCRSFPTITRPVPGVWGEGATRRVASGSSVRPGSREVWSQ